MLISLLGILYFLVFAPRSAFSLFEFIAYPGAITQCDVFNVSFSKGTLPAALPLSLTILPFNSTPLAFTVPNSAWDNSTSSGSFAITLPLPAGVALLAALDDAAGHSAAPISDVIQVQPSPNTSCLSSNTTVPVPFQLVDSTVSQCSPFSVSRNTSSLDNPISARGFIPGSQSFKLKWAAYRESDGVDMFTFIMSVAQGIDVAMLFDDGLGNCQVSDLLAVQGNENSPNGCLQPGSPLSTSAALGGSQSLSRPAVIAISVSSSVIILIILVLGILFVRRERRRLTGCLGGSIKNRRSTLPSPLLILGPLEPSNPSRTGTPEAKPSSSPAPVDPVYPMFGFGASSTAPRAARNSTRSTILAPFTPKSRSLRSTKSRSSVNRSFKSTRTKNSTKGSSTRRLADLDIEGLLEQASHRRVATEAPRGYPAASPHTVTPVPTVSVPPSPSRSSYTFSVRNPTSPRESNHHPAPDVPRSPLTSVSQDWFSLERPPASTAAVSALASRNDRNMPSQGMRPLPSSPFLKPTVFALSKNSV